jgi:hypothetical protein
VKAPGLEQIQRNLLPIAERVTHEVLSRRTGWTEPILDEAIWRDLLSSAPPKVEREPRIRDVEPVDFVEEFITYIAAVDLVEAMERIDAFRPAIGDEVDALVSFLAEADIAAAM